MSSEEPSAPPREAIARCSAVYSAVRQVLIGAAAAAITYGVGAAIGVSLA
ncbi:MAG TPA: hypothetical protein VFX67_07095 [Burkholderiales bacterium]|nr:hypothetical protein [Burkholderiales bacterium]